TGDNIGTGCVPGFSWVVEGHGEWRAGHDLRNGSNIPTFKQLATNTVVLRIAPARAKGQIITTAGEEGDSANAVRIAAIALRIVGVLRRANFVYIVDALSPVQAALEKDSVAITLRAFNLKLIGERRTW